MNILFSILVTLCWFREPDAVDYRVYWGMESGRYEWSTNSHNATNITITGLTDGQTYFFAATAIDDRCRESKPSLELVWPQSECSAPKVFQAGNAVNIEYGPTVTGPWTPLGTVSGSNIFLKLGP